jgi:hypothetical protein
LEDYLTFSIGYLNKTFTLKPVTALFENFLINKAGELTSLPSFADYTA